MINTEKAFDMLPTVVTIYDKLKIDEYIKVTAEENKGKKKANTIVTGIAMFKYILKRSQDVKEEIFEVVSIFEEKTIEEIKTQSFIKTINSMKKIFTDKDATELFKQAIK